MKQNEKQTKVKKQYKQATKLDEREYDIKTTRQRKRRNRKTKEQNEKMKKGES